MHTIHGVVPGLAHKISRLVYHDAWFSALKEQICSSRLSTIDHDPPPSSPSPRAPRRFKSRFTDNDACALANPVNSLLVHAVTLTITPSSLDGAGNVHVSTVNQLSPFIERLNVRAWFEFFESKIKEDEIIDG